jgi:hypothetical protein
MPNQKPLPPNGDAWINTTWTLFSNCFHAFVELTYGIRANTIPWITCCGAGSIISVLITFRVDRLAFRKAGLLFFCPTRPTVYWPYCFFMITSPFWIWAFKQVVMRLRLLKKLTAAFTDSGLKTSGGRLPSFVSNIPIDQFTQKLRLRNVGISLSDYKRTKDALGANLQVYIDDVRENRRNGTIDIIYSNYDITLAAL